MGSAKVGKNCAYLEAIESNILEEPAAKAWLQIDPGNEPPRRIETLRRWESTKPFVCRMLGIDSVGTPIIAKRCKKAAGLQEKMFYEEILPQLGMSGLEYHGSFEEGNDYLWLFLEDVGGRRFSFHKDDDRQVAVEWLTRLHTSSAKLGKPPQLIERGAAYYHERLTTAQSTLRLNVDRDIFSATEQQIMSQALDLIDCTESGWESITALYERLPHCVIHGDFKSKNIHLLSDGQETIVFVFDWEYAGWGIPGIDMWRLDKEEYLLAVKEHWPHISRNTLRELQNLGSVFRFIDSYFWEVKRLHHPIDATAKLKLKQNLFLFNEQMADALQQLDTPAKVYSQAAG